MTAETSAAADAVVPRALILVDIDGVVNARGFEDGGERVWPEDTWREKYVVENSLGYRVDFSTAAIEALRALESMPGVTMRWCTTWQALAPRKFARKVGIGDRWQFVKDFNTGRRPDEVVHHWWKAERVRLLLASGEFDRIVWLDDEALGWRAEHQSAANAAERFAWMDDLRLLVLSPHEDLGLEPHHFDTVKEFLS